MHPSVRLSEADGGKMEDEFRYEVRKLLGFDSFTFNSKILEEIKRLKKVEEDYEALSR